MFSRKPFMHIMTTFKVRRFQQPVETGSKPEILLANECLIGGHNNIFLQIQSRALTNYIFYAKTSVL